MEKGNGNGRVGGNGNGWRTPWKEVAVMRQFNHPNLLPLYAAELDPPQVSGSGSSPRRANLIFPAYPEAGGAVRSHA